MVDQVAQRVARRFLGTGRFQTPWDLESYLSDNPQLGWKKLKSSHDLWMFQKRIDGIWLKMIFGDYSREVRLWPSRMPKTIPVQEWSKYEDELQVDVPIKGSTLADIERAAQELVKRYKEIAGPRRQRDVSEIRYQRSWDEDPLVGKPALKAWEEDIEKELQDIIDNGASRGKDYITRELTEDILDNRRLQLEGRGIDRRFMSRAIRAILEDMAKRGKIEKDTNEPRLPRWLGLQWKAPPRPYY